MLMKSYQVLCVTVGCYQGGAGGGYVASNRSKRSRGLKLRSRIASEAQGRPGRRSEGQWQPRRGKAITESSQRKNSRETVKKLILVMLVRFSDLSNFIFKSRRYTDDPRMTPR